MKFTFVLPFEYIFKNSEELDRFVRYNIPDAKLTAVYDRMGLDYEKEAGSWGEALTVAKMERNVVEETLRYLGDSLQ